MLFTVTIVFMAGILYGVAKKTEKELDHKCILWPDWAWWLTILNAFIWVAACELFRRGNGARLLRLSCRPLAMMLRIGGGRVDVDEKNPCPGDSAVV